MKTTHLLLLSGLILWSGTAVHAKDEATSSDDRLNGKKIELARYAKAYVAPGNITVEVAPYKSGSTEGAILLFKGVESSWDGKAIDHRLTSGGRDYTTRVDGKDYVSMTVREGKATLYLPDVKDEIRLTPSDGAAQLTSPRKIFMEYQEQQTPKKGN